METDLVEVLELERRRLRALVERDIAVADRLHSAEYQLISPAGVAYTKDTYLADISAKRLEYVAFTPESPVAARVSSRIIILRYVAVIRLSVGIGEVLEFRAWHTDHYERVDGSWAVVWSQATRIAEPTRPPVRP
jgi:hypothetical protein